MPHYYEKDHSKLAVRLEELVPVWWPSYDALYKNIKRNAHIDGYGVKRLQRACRGQEVLFDFDSLPMEIQNALGDVRKAKVSMLEKYYRRDTKAVDFFYQYTFPGTRSGLNESNIPKYIVNASTLNAAHQFKLAHIKERESKKRKATRLYRLMANECQAFLPMQKTLFGVEHTLPTSGRRFKEIYNDYFLEDGARNYASLISGKERNENSRKVTRQVERLLDSIFAKANQKPTMIKVATQYNLFMVGKLDVVYNDTGEVANPGEYPDISNSTIRAWLSSWESKIATHKLRSADRQQYRGLYIPYAETELPKQAGSLLSIDDRQPPFEYDKTKRIWMYNGADVASGAITATVWGKTKEGILLNFYRKIIQNNTDWGVGMPKELEAEVSLNASYRQSFLSEGALFDRVRLEANNARGKYIERINRELRLSFEKDLPGFIGRWHARSEAYQPESKDNIYRTQKYTPADVIAKQSQRVIEKYNNSAHTRDSNISRWEYFMKRQRKDLKAPNWRAVLPSLGYHTRTSCRVGRIQFHGEKHFIGYDGEILAGDDLIDMMRQIEGQQLHVYWLDKNDGSLLKGLVFLNDQYICEAVPVPKFQRSFYERTPEDEENRMLQMKYISTVEAYMRRYKNDIEEVTLLEKKEEEDREYVFKMPGLDTDQEKEKNGWDEDEPARILEDLPEDELDDIEEYSGSSMMDRF